MDNLLDLMPFLINLAEAQSEQVISAHISVYCYKKMNISVTTSLNTMNHPTPYSATSPISPDEESLHSVSELLIDEDELSRVDVFVTSCSGKESGDFVKAKLKLNSINCPKAGSLVNGENDIPDGGLVFDDFVTELFKKPVLSCGDKLLRDPFFETNSSQNHPKGALAVVRTFSQSSRGSEIKEKAKTEEENDELGNSLSTTLDGAMQIIQSTSYTRNHTMKRSKLRMTRSLDGDSVHRRAGWRHRSSNGKSMMQYPNIYQPKSIEGYFSKVDDDLVGQADDYKHVRLLSQASTISSLGLESLSDIVSEVERRKSLPVIDSTLRKDETMHDSVPKRPSRCRSPCPSS